MVFWELVGAAVRFGTAELMEAEFGPLGLLLLVLATAAVRTRHAPLAWWAAFVFFLLLVQA
ncbi:hypothetical protein [Streptomyces sp. NPDC002845]